MSTGQHAPSLAAAGNYCMGAAGRRRSSCITTTTAALAIKNYVLFLFTLIGLHGTICEAQSAGDQQQFLTLHNKARAALGEVALTWDSQLATYAANYAVHVQCQMVHSGGPYGENLFWGSAGKQWTPSDALATWLAEAPHYHYHTNACDAGAMCGHYTQVVWSSTTAVGCATQVCNDGTTLIVCEYNPPGNYVGRRPF